MHWNVASECTSTVILCIIWIYARKGFSLNSLKNKLFQACFMTTFCAMTTNIVSTILIYQVAPTAITWIITLIYFLTTPLTGIVYFFYAVSILYEHQIKIPRLFAVTVIPAIGYTLLVVLNPFTKWLFDYNVEDGYFQGPLILTTYLIFYVYCLGCFVIVLIKGRLVDAPIRRILAGFPIIAGLVVIIQQMYPSVILSGSAATCALLLVYLYLQNKQISIDYLMGIPNRQEFLDMLYYLIKKRGGKPFFVAVFSMRHFKQINDKFGQHMGNNFLKAISSYFKEHSKPHRIYRISGDEIALLMETNKQPIIEETMTKLYMRMQEPWQSGEYSYKIESVIGAISYPDSINTREDVINGLEYAIAQAKEDPASGVCYCTSEMLQKARRKQQLIGIIKDAMEKDQMEVYFQPIWSIKKQRFTLAESLLRMPTTPIGPIYPDEFIPIAEDTGMIIDLTYMVLHKACDFVKCLLEQNVEIESATVNLSGVQVTQSGLAEKIFSIIDEHEIPYNTIKLEITESVLADDLEIMEVFLLKMRAKGIQIGLDDFGTGYCNLVSIMNMPLDVVKIDKSILWSSMTNEKSAIMTKSIIQAISDLGMKTVTEGVETEEQRKFVEDCKGDWIQGFLFAKPVPREDAERLFLKQ